MSGYHHGNLRQALIEAGVDLARAQGPSGVKLREAARRSGVSHNAAYRHFAGHGEYLGEIAGVAMQLLGTAMQRELATVAPALPAGPRAEARIRATGRAYVEFAVAEPGLFGVAFSADPASTEPATDPDAPVEPDPHPYDLLTLVLDEGLAAGVVSAEARPGAEVVCWSAVHGFAVLHVTGPLRGTSEADRVATLEVLLDQVSRALA